MRSFNWRSLSRIRDVPRKLACAQISRSRRFVSTSAVNLSQPWQSLNRFKPVRLPVCSSSALPSPSAPTFGSSHASSLSLSSLTRKHKSLSRSMSTSSRSDSSFLSSTHCRRACSSMREPKSGGVDESRKPEETKSNLLPHYGKWHTGPTPESAKKTWRFIPSWMLKPHIVAREDFNRWLIPPVAVASHLCIGSIYAFSLLNEPLTRTLGGVVSSASDWSLSTVVPVFSISIVCLGLSAAIAGKALEEVGPRTIGSAAAVLWGGSWLIGAVAVSQHNLSLLYLQGIIGGCGLGLGYVSPVSTMLRWFEDRRGLAAGMAIVGFGGGSAVLSPLFGLLLEKFFVPPTYLGSPEFLFLITENGKRYCEVAGEKLEVVVASVSDIAKLGLSPAMTETLNAGVYVVNTGNTGVATTFACIGAVYTVVMLVCAFCYRLPPEGWRPPKLRVQPRPLPNSVGAHAVVPPAQHGVAVNHPVVQVAHAGAAAMHGVAVTAPVRRGVFDFAPTTHHVDIDEALRTQQFYQLWTNLFCNVTAGIGVIAIAKTIMSDVFAASNPGLVTAQFCAGYVAAISIANLFGRIGWAAVSDKLGRKRIFALYFGAGVPLYFCVPLTASWAATSPDSALPLAVFTTATLTCFSFYGAGFSTIPAFIADVFGTKFVGGIHGRLLTAWSMAGVVGPLTVTYLRDASTERAIRDLASKVDPEVFEMVYRAPISELSSLVAQKTVTIANLMQLTPPGILDPTPGLYSSSFYLMGGILAVAFVNNILIRPVHPKHHMKD